MVSPSIGIEVRVEYPDVDGLLDAPGGLVIFLVKDPMCPNQFVPTTDVLDTGVLPWMYIFCVQWTIL